MWRLLISHGTIGGRPRGTRNDKKDSIEPCFLIWCRTVTTPQCHATEFESMSQPPSCYMCSRRSKSREHVPPCCLFPESKDVGGQYRRNLITVPSCDKHNSQKCADDEFLMVSLAGIIGNNSIGYMHKFSKVNRAIQRSSFALLQNAMTNQRWHVVEILPNKFLDVIWGTPDCTRLNQCFDRIARGLFYHRFGRRFRGRTKTILGYVTPDAPNPAAFQRFIRDKIQLELKGKERCGANPEVFSFQFTDPDPLGLYSLYLQFYGGLDVYVALMPTRAKLPYNLGMDLLNMGIPTTITLGERCYHFNCEAEDVEDAG